MLKKTHTEKLIKINIKDNKMIVTCKRTNNFEHLNKIQYENRRIEQLEKKMERIRKLTKNTFKHERYTNLKK